MGLSEHTQKGLWSKLSESEYEYLLPTTLGYILDALITHFIHVLYLTVGVYSRSSGSTSSFQYEEGRTSGNFISFYFKSQATV